VTIPKISIAPPTGATVLAARHLDQTEGPVQVGAVIDQGTRSAINTVLRYIATAHNAPPVADGRSTPRRPCRYCTDPLCPEDCPECGCPMHDLDAVPAWRRSAARPEEQHMADTTPAAEALLVAFDEFQLAEMHAAASARIKRVRALHVRQYDECAWCSTNDRHASWPCPTIAALDGEEPTP
jgi:hypothetical protein